MDFPCPGCGFLVFDEPAGSYAICPVCDWEDDHVQLKHPSMGGGANGESLREHQAIVLQTLPLGVNTSGEWKRDSAWRPAREGDGETMGTPKNGLAYFNAAAEESAEYYWRAG